jgi:hypothetical protein
MQSTVRRRADRTRGAWTFPHARRRQFAAILVLLLVPAVSACGRPEAQAEPRAVGSTADSAFRDRDTGLLHEIDALNARCAPTWRTDAQCVTQACRLRARELDLFGEVRAHGFTDMTESNYWHRGRLKFPGDLEQVLRRLKEESPRSGPPCMAAGADGPAPKR